MSFSFKDLDLSNVTAAKGGAVLSAGRYVVKVRDAEIKDTKKKDGSKILSIKYSCDEGVITDNLNVFSTSSPEAQRIGREQYKGMLECSGHPNPSNPGGVESLVGLTVGIIVGEDGEYQGKTSYKVKAYMKPADIGAGGSEKKMTEASANAPAIGAAKGGLPF